MERVPVSNWHLIKRLRLYLLAIPLGVSVGFGSVGICKWKQLKPLFQNGVVLDAVIIGRNEERHGLARANPPFPRHYNRVPSSRTYHLLYSYTVHGQSDPLVHYKRVSRAIYSRSRLGETLPVTYAAAQPELASIDLRFDRFQLIVHGAISAIAALATLGLGWWMSGPAFSVIRALRYGEIRKAQVTGLNIQNTSMRRYNQCRLEWCDMTGEMGQSLLASYSKLYHYPVGTVITVYIDPKTGKGWWEAQIA